MSFHHHLPVVPEGGVAAPLLQLALLLGRRPAAPLMRTITSTGPPGTRGNLYHTTTALHPRTNHFPHLLPPPPPLVKAPCLLLVATPTNSVPVLIVAVVPIPIVAIIPIPVVEVVPVLVVAVVPVPIVADVPVLMAVILVLIVVHITRVIVTDGSVLRGGIARPGDHPEDGTVLILQAGTPHVCMCIPYIAMQTTPQSFFLLKKPKLGSCVVCVPLGVSLSISVVSNCFYNGYSTGCVPLHRLLAQIMSSNVSMEGLVPTCLMKKKKKYIYI